MMTQWGLARTAMVAAALGALAATATAGDSPKGAVAVKYGTTSEAQPGVPLPPPLPPAKQTAAKAS